MTVTRIAGAAGTIESNARAALGVMQYLDRQQLFPSGPAALRHITQAIHALIALVNGNLPPEAVANQIAVNEQVRVNPQTGRILLRETLARVRELGANGSSLRCNFDNFYAHTLYRAEGYEPNDLLWAFKFTRSVK